MSFPRYPKYKDSGVEWLGEVPEEWVVCRLGHNLNQPPCYGVLVPDFEVDGVPMLRIMDLAKGIPRVEDITTISKNLSDEYQRTLLNEGDVVLSVVGSIGLAFVVSGTLIGTNLSRALARLVPNSETLPQWIKWFFCSRGFRQFIDLVCVGTAQRVLNMDDLRSFRMPFPSLQEQQTISTFLDRETAKIDALVAEQENLIALLKEKRQAVISHAVTKGLDPTVPMKDSGIEWLGEVPERWEVKRIRHVATLNPSKSEVANLAPDTEVSFLPMEAVGEDGKLNLDRTRPLSEVDTGYTYFREGDVTIAKITPCYENGKGAVMRGLINNFGFGTTELTVIRPRENQATSDYLHCLFNSTTFRMRGEAAMYGAGGQKRVPDDFVRDFALAFPPIGEQQAIAAFLDTETAKFDDLTTEAQHTIDLLKERRSALISAAVTGKIDVRGYHVHSQPVL